MISRPWREAPRHFKEKIAGAVKSMDGLIVGDQLNQVLVNISSLLSDTEVIQLLKESGSKNRSIETSTILELI